MSEKKTSHAKRAHHVPGKHHQAPHPHPVPTLEDAGDMPGANEVSDLEADVRYRMVSEAAYHRYLDRGCVDGFETEDWLAAEADVDRKLYDATKQDES